MTSFLSGTEQSAICALLMLKDWEPVKEVQQNQSLEKQR